MTMWRRVARRRAEALDVLSRLKCTTTSGLASRLGISHSQAAYLLRVLEREGGVVKHKVGRAAVWCAAPVPQEELYILINPCFKHAEEALKELLEGARGAVRTITPLDLIKAMERLHRRSCAAPLGRLYALAAARAWLMSRLDGAIIDVKRRETKAVQFIVDVRKARERLAAAVAAAAV